MYDLFSSMDFVWYHLKSVNSLLLVLGVVPVAFLAIGGTVYSRLYSGKKSLVYSLISMFQSEVKKNIWGFGRLVVSLFVGLLVFNIWGLFPGLFGVSCQIVCIVFLSLQLWLSINLSSVSNGFSAYVSHLTPLGSPLPLAPLLNIIEVVSKVIRPLTLRLRLCINMTTGHILLGLVSMGLRYVFSVGGLFSVVLLAVLLGYFLFEVAICTIQASVYALLVQQYTDEHTV